MRPRDVPPTPVLRSTLPCRPPFRLDLTVTALRRLPTNLVDVFEGDRYLRAFSTDEGPVVWEVRHVNPHLEVALYGAVEDASPYLKQIDRMLGASIDHEPYYAMAEKAPPSFARLVDEFWGMKPPRTASLWETFVNTVPFQQLSLKSAMTVLGRLIRLSGEPVDFQGVSLYLLPLPGRFAQLGIEQVRSVGLSGTKARALLDAAAAIDSASVDESSLDALDSGALAKKLQSFRGVGPWTAALMLLRGFRRLETFPAKDAGAIAGLRNALPGVDAPGLLEELGPYRGMLYYHLLLARGVMP